MDDKRGGKSKLHPDASPIVDCRAGAQAFLYLKNIEQMADAHFSDLKSSPEFEDIESKFAISKEFLIPSELLHDPKIFSDWGCLTLRSQTYVIDQVPTAAPERSPTKESSPEPVQEKLSLVEDLAKRTSPFFSIGHRKYQLDDTLEKSGLRSLSHLSRMVFSSLKREPINKINLKSLARTNKKGSGEKFREGEVIYDIAVYFPGRAPVKKLQQLKILGSQPLTDLRDAIYCQEDFLAYPILEKTLENERNVLAFNQNLAPPTITYVTKPNEENTATKKTSASYFFFENVFYVDCRLESAMDYTVELFRWNADPQLSNNPPILDLVKMEMAGSTFDQLKLRVNQPYLFCHQGKCEHIIIVQSIRLAHPVIDVYSANFPITTFQASKRRVLCSTCRTSFADYAAVNDMHGGLKTMFYCQPCHEMFHLTSDGLPVYPVCLYPYIYD